MTVPKPAGRTRRAHVPPAAAARRIPRTGRADVPPVPIKLGEAGKRWWRWAWMTPQAITWHDGYTQTLARRARLEDMWTETGDERLLAAMARLDDAFGLTPRAAAQLHLEFEDEPEIDETPPDVTDIRSRLKKLG
jgi:hypothetical protein